MAGHIQDRWYKTNPDGTGRPIKSERYGTGLRYRARYVGPDGTEESKSFPDRQKRLAEQWLALIEADMSRGQYIDPAAGRVTFQQYGEKWLASQTTDVTTRTSVSTQLRLHVLPYIAARPLGSFQPAHIREWTSALEKVLPVSSYRRVIFSSVSAVFSASVDDKHLPANPCRARSVRALKSTPPRVQPWTPSRVFAVRAALPEQSRAMVDLGGGCGLRQGEIFGLAEDAVNYETGWLHIGCQIKVASGHLVFGLPKRSKDRDVPMSDHVAQVLKEHTQKCPPIDVTLPWLLPQGRKVTKRLFFARLDGRGAVRRTDFNTRVWKAALTTAGVIKAPEKGQRHPASREDGMHALRHFYASVLLAAGENVKALSHYLGHDDPGFTLRVYTHLMPSSDGRARRAVDAMYAAHEGPAGTPDGPQTAQAA